MRYLLLIILCMAAVVFFTLLSIDRTQQDRESVKSSDNHPINDDLLTRIALVESSNNPKAVSKKGAVGLYQIRYAVWGKTLKKEGIIKGRSCLYNPQVNKTAALYILHHYHNQTGDIRKTLAKYSGGAKNYAEKVLDK